jgi:hypothetical protein
MLSMLALALAAALAAAETPPANETAAPHKDAEKQVCVTKAKVGTRFKDRICYDKAEYERRQLEERQALQRIQRIPLKAE